DPAIVIVTGFVEEHATVDRAVEENPVVTIGGRSIHDGGYPVAALRLEAAPCVAAETGARHRGDSVVEHVRGRRGTRVVLDPVAAEDDVELAHEHVRTAGDPDRRVDAVACDDRQLVGGVGQQACQRGGYRAGAVHDAHDEQV